MRVSHARIRRPPRSHPPHLAKSLRQLHEDPARSPAEFVSSRRLDGVSPHWLTVWSGATGPRRTLVRMDSAVAVQTRGLGSLLWIFMYSSIAAIRSGREWNTPRRRALPVSSGNHRSTRLSQDEDVGVKCSWNRGCLTNQASTSLCLWVA